MSFGDIKGHDRVISFLKSAIENNRVAHAYLFLGPQGIGKRLTAFGFAEALNGVKDAASHPDVFLVKPEKGKTEIGIDAVREVIRRSSLKPYEAKFKVFIIDGADSMTAEAANAFLKTLEEPPQDTVLVLIAQNANAILPTILSRLQVIRFFPIGTIEVKDILMKDYGMEAAEAEVLSRISSGRLGNALKLRDEDFFAKRARTIKDLVAGTFFDSDFEDFSGEEIKVFLDIALAWYRDILVAKTNGGEPQTLVNVDKKDSVLKEARRLGFDYLDRIIKGILLTNSYLENNANPKLAMSVLGLAMIENSEV